MALQNPSTCWLNTLCKNTKREKMEMTTPVFTSKSQSDGEKMDMTTPVITKKVAGQDEWKMSFVMPSKYGSNLPLPKDPSVRIKEVPKKIVAVIAFSGFVSDEEVERRGTTHREALKKDTEYRVKNGASAEVAQVVSDMSRKRQLALLMYNPLFTLPFTRRNEVALEVERIQEEILAVQHSRPHIPFYLVKKKFGSTTSLFSSQVK